MRMVDEEGYEFEVWGREFILLSTGQIKRFSRARFGRLFGKMNQEYMNTIVRKSHRIEVPPLLPRDPFRDVEIRRHKGKYWVRLADLHVRTGEKDPFTNISFSQYEVTASGLLKRNSCKWKPTADQVSQMKAMTLKRKVRRPPMKSVSPKNRYKFN